MSASLVKSPPPTPACLDLEKINLQDHDYEMTLSSNTSIVPYHDSVSATTLANSQNSTFF